MIETPQLIRTIEEAWEDRANISTMTRGEIRSAIDLTLNALDDGVLRIAEKMDGKWHTHQWLKKAVLLSFRLYPSAAIGGGGDYRNFNRGAAQWYDKVPSKFSGWGMEDFHNAGFRAVPGCYVRRSAYIGAGVVLMPSFVNVGAYIDQHSMIDSWATVGSCAQIGKRCHISGGVGIGGVLEPLQANPVIIEDDCFIGARAEIAEGVIIEQGAVIAMGVYLGASTKIVDRADGSIYYGRVPAYSVVVPGNLPGPTLPGGAPGPGLYCAVIVKRVDAQTREKTAINDLLRD